MDLLLLALSVSAYQQLSDSTCSFTGSCSVHTLLTFSEIRVSLNVGRVHMYTVYISIESDLKTRATCSRDNVKGSQCIALAVACFQPEFVCFRRRLDRSDEPTSLRQNLLQCQM